MDGESPSAVFKLVFGGLSGIFAQVSCYPIDIVRRRMQTAGEFIEVRSSYRSYNSYILSACNIFYALIASINVSPFNRERSLMEKDYSTFLHWRMFFYEKYLS